MADDQGLNHGYGVNKSSFQAGSQLDKDKEIVMAERQDNLQGEGRGKREIDLGQSFWRPLGHPVLVLFGLLLLSH